MCRLGLDWDALQETLHCLATCNATTMHIRPHQDWTPVYFTVFMPFSSFIQDLSLMFAWPLRMLRRSAHSHSFWVLAREKASRQQSFFLCSKTEFIVMTAANDWQLSRDRPGPGILSEAEQRRETIFPPQPTQVPEPGTNFSHHSPHRPPLSALFLVNFNLSTRSLFSLKFVLFSGRIQISDALMLIVTAQYSQECLIFESPNEIFQSGMKQSWHNANIENDWTLFQPGPSSSRNGQTVLTAATGREILRSWHFMIPMILFPPALVNQHWMCRLFTFCSWKYRRRHDTAIESTYPDLTM